MNTFFNPNTETFLTLKMSVDMGLTDNKETLIAHGFYPVQYLYPQYDDNLYRIVTDGFPLPDRDNPNAYIQTFLLEPLALPVARSGLKFKVASRRYDVEMGGMNWTDADGATVRINTNVDARTRLQTAIDAIPEGSTPGAINYKLGGSFRNMTHAELLALRDAIAKHVQECFNHEAFLNAQIDSANSVAELEDIIVETGW